MPPYTHDEVRFIRLLERCEAMLLPSHSHALALGEDLAMKIPVFVDQLTSFIEDREKESVNSSEFIQRHKPRVEELTQSLRKWQTSQRRKSEALLPVYSEVLPSCTSPSPVESPTLVRQDTLEGYQAEQDRLANELKDMTQGLKSLSVHARNVIRTDIGKLHRANDLTDRSTAKLANTNTKLKKYNRQWHCTCQLCLLFFVFVAFICMVMLMKVIGKSV